MTDKAIELLSKNEKGFFWQVEGASIDNRITLRILVVIGETVDFDEAVQRALEFAKKEGNTLVIVTADHAHASQIVAPDTKAPGLTAPTTKDGAATAMSYGNSEEDSQEHTGSQLRIAAYGPHAANVVGLTDQTDLLHHESRPGAEIKPRPAVNFRCRVVFLLLATRLNGRSRSNADG
ncbi:alkaline phosphatase [Escherichia coli]